MSYGSWYIIARMQTDGTQESYMNKNPRNRSVELVVSQSHFVEGSVSPGKLVYYTLTIFTLINVCTNLNIFSKEKPLAL